MTIAVCGFCSISLLVFDKSKIGFSDSPFDVVWCFSVFRLLCSLPRRLFEEFVTRSYHTSDAPGGGTRDETLRESAWESIFSDFACGFRFLSKFISVLRFLIIIII